MKVFKILFLIGVCGFLFYLIGYPLLIDVSYLKHENPTLTAMMKYRMKQWEKQGKNIKIKQIWVPLNSISPYMIKAVLIAEDDKFFRHEGFDFEAIEKAIERNLKEGKLKYGGSTISQQVSKNLFLNPSKNPVRKIQEAIITIKLERTLSKKRILEIYLNIAEWGEGIFGVEAASRHYFGKSAKYLTPWEAARLAAVLPNPLKYNPLSNHPYVEKRSKLIYMIMKRRGIIKEEYQDVEKQTEDTSQTTEDLQKQNTSSSSEQSDEKPIKEPESRDQVHTNIEKDKLKDEKSDLRSTN